MKQVTALVFGFALVAAMLIADTKLKMEDLPPAVQKTVKDTMKGATLVGISKEVEKGKTSYEVETKLNGRSRDFVVDAKGALVDVEDEVDLASIPAAAKAAIEKKAAGGTITKVEQVTQGSKVSYEAVIKSKAGKNTEFGVNADGTVHK